MEKLRCLQKLCALKFQKILLSNCGPTSSAMDGDEAAPDRLTKMKPNQPMSNNGNKENSGHAVQHDTTSNNLEQNPQEHP